MNKPHRAAGAYTIQYELAALTKSREIAKLVHQGGSPVAFVGAINDPAAGHSAPRTEGTRLRTEYPPDLRHDVLGTRR